MKLHRLWILAGMAIPVAIVAPHTVSAQSDQAQLVPPAGAADLSSNLARLASNPRDVNALIGAGNAALALDDPRAAAGFFARADAITSGDGRIKAGLARVMLKLQNPAEAARLFDQAARLGVPDVTVLADRGLARDLMGDQAAAQRDYAAALVREPNEPDLRRNYAASLGISGQVGAAEKLLEPLLYKSDRAAWRYRAFILAMNNRQDEAKKIAEQTMPGDLAQAIVPYLRKMPYLTPQQKAAALHYGHFPTQIGTQIAAVIPTPPPAGLAQAEPPPTRVASVETKTQPDRRGRTERRSRSRRRGSEPVAVATATTPAPGFSQASAPVPAASVPPASVQQAPVQSAPAQSAPAPTSPPAPARRDPVFAAADPVVQRLPSSSPPAPQPAPLPRTDTVAGPPAPTASPSADSGIGSQLNAITLAQASAPSAGSATGNPPPPAETPPPAAATPAPAAPAMVQVTRSLADIIRAIDVPESERTASVAAVDLNEIAALQAAAAERRRAEAEKTKAAAKAKAEADARKKKEAEEKARLAANPARSWVQISTGRQRGPLGFTLKALRKQYADIASQDAWIASWGATNRLLIGPFASFTRAKAVEGSLKAAGADVFAWQSDAGEAVERFTGN